MQNSIESQRIVENFHEALIKLKADKKIRGIQTFTRKYNLDKRALYKSRRETNSGAFEIGWLYLLARDYDVSADWLLMRRGEFYTKKQRCCANPVQEK